MYIEAMDAFINSPLQQWMLAGIILAIGICRLLGRVAHLYEEEARQRQLRTGG